MKKVSKKDFVKAILENDTLEDAGKSLASLRGGVALKPQSVYNRYNKLRKEGANLPDRPLQPSSQMSVEEINSFIESQTKQEATPAE